MSTTFLVRTFVAALTLTASLAISGGTTTAPVAGAAAVPTLTSYVLPADGDQGDDNTNKTIHHPHVLTPADTGMDFAAAEQTKASAQPQHPQIEDPVVGKTIKYCKVTQECLPVFGPPRGLVAATFSVTGSGSADSIVIDHGSIAQFHYVSLPFTRTFYVDPNVGLLQVHESGAHQTSVGCTITLNGRVVSHHPTGGDCVYNKN